MTKTRDEIAEVAMAVLRSLDHLKSQGGFTHEEMIFAVAAALAQMPDEDREKFQAAFDLIKKQMYGPKPDDAAHRLS